MASKVWNYYLKQFDVLIINAGIDDSLSLNEQRMIKLINIGAIISGIFCMMVLCLTIFIIPDSKVIFICLLLTIFYFLFPLINYLQYFRFSKFFAVLYFSGVIIFWNLYVIETPYFLLLPLTASSLFYTKYAQRILAFIIFFAIFIYIKHIPFYLDTIPSIFYDFCLFFAVLVLISFVYQITQEYESEMSKLNESLLAQNKKLEQQQQLQKSEQFFRSIFENTYLGIIVVGAESEIKRVNAVFCKQLGFEEAYILNHRFIDFNVKKSDYMADFFRLIKGEITHFETKEVLQRSKGRIMNAELIVNGVYDINGDFLEAIITIQDITETFKAQEAIRESELKFRSIFDNSPMGITITHLAQEKVVDVNQVTLDTLGITREAFFEMQENGSLADRTNIKKEGDIIQRLVNEEVKSITTTKWFKKSDGSELTAELTRSIINLNGEEYVITVSKDITVNKMIERELEARYQEMQTFFDAIPISFLYLDTENRILRGNRISLGRNPEKYKGRLFSTVFPMIKDDNLLMNSKVMQEGKPLLNQIEYYEIKGNGVWVRVDRIPVKDENGEVSGILIFSTDITEVKKAEGELAVKNAELEHYIETNLQLESFAYIASHDLKEPLRMIHSFTQLLHRRLKPHFDKDATEYMNYILSGVHRMEHLLDDLLKYSTIGRQEKRLELVDLNDTIYNVIQNLQHTVKEKNTEIYVDPLPKVKALPIQMTQLFQNLISNAMKFVPEGKKPAIRIYVKERSNSYEFEVKDNGIGVQKEYLQKIFLVFKRLHGKNEYEGTGIGLATCKKIIDNLKGQIWVESEYGKGASFFFTIPKSEN